MLLRNSDKFNTCRITVINVVRVNEKCLAFFFLRDPETAKHHKKSMGVTLLGLQKKTTNFNWQEQAGFLLDSCCRQQGFRCGILFFSVASTLKMFVSISRSVSFKHFLPRVKKTVQ